MSALAGLGVVEGVRLRRLTAFGLERQIEGMNRGPMSSIRNVCVYCGSSDGNDARFGEAAEAFGRILAEEGIGLVYGGGGDGLMGRLARSTLASGG
jgi:predicted Rossmann-fold nucleotide-binding protein